MRLKSFIVLLAFFLAGCHSAEEEVVYVFAASSLQESVTTLSAAFQAVHPDVQINLNFAGSNTLATQISNGFPADVFLSAHSGPLQQLEVMRADVFAENEVILVSSHPHIRSIYDLPEANLILASEAVPIGMYAKEILEKLDVRHPGLQERILGQVITRTDNVRQALLKFTLGEGDTTFIYRTDLIAASDDAAVIEIPEPYGVMAQYWLALLTPAGEAFYDFIMSDAGQEVLRRYGFQ